MDSKLLLSKDAVFSALKLTVGVTVIGYALYHWIMHRIHVWIQSVAKQCEVYLPESHEQMVKLANSKTEEQMTEKEFGIKYGPYRQVLFFASGFRKERLSFMNRFLQMIEVYWHYGGYNKVKEQVKIDRPIFIIGDFRSGTSVLERIIAHHPSVYYFNTTNVLVWSAPRVFEAIMQFLESVKRSLGMDNWNDTGNKGIYYAHSANNLLTRASPMENEGAWEMSQGSLVRNRNCEWDTLDSPSNPDNCSGDLDVMTEQTDDYEFENLFKTAIRLINLQHSHCYNNDRKTRFINKNPLNGYRLGYLKRIFPDAKFIYIRRNPVRTCISQLLMEKTNLRVMFMDGQQVRRADMHPKPIPMSDFTTDESKQHWSFVMRGQYPNEVLRTLWFPRVFPRTEPEHLHIQEYIKQDKLECADAVAVVQHNRVVNEALERLDLVDGKDIIEVWHEDLIEDATFTMRSLFKFLELDLTEAELRDILEAEDFPNGYANPIRVGMSRKRNNKAFENDTEECEKILQEMMDTFNNRTPLKQRLGVVFSDDTKEE